MVHVLCIARHGPPPTMQPDNVQKPRILLTAYLFRNFPTQVLRNFNTSLDQQQLFQAAQNMLDTLEEIFLHLSMHHVDYNWERVPHDITANYALYVEDFNVKFRAWQKVDLKICVDMLEDELNMFYERMKDNEMTQINIPNVEEELFLQAIQTLRIRLQNIAGAEHLRQYDLRRATRNN